MPTLIQINSNVALRSKMKLNSVNRIQSLAGGAGTLCLGEAQKQLSVLEHEDRNNEKSIAVSGTTECNLRTLI